MPRSSLHASCGHVQKMNSEQFLFLIETYKEYRTLSDPKDKNYYNNIIREDDWRTISAIVGRPVAEIKAKMKSLMGTYRREKSRQKQSQITGSGKENIYVLKWFAYDYFSFLSDCDKPSQTVDTVTEEPDSSIPTVDDLLSQRPDVIDNISGPSSTGRKRKDCLDPLENASKKRRRTKSKSISEDDMLQTAFSILKNSANANTDPYVTYGQHIANELRKYDPHTLIIVKQAINDIIFKADLGKLNSLESNCSTISSSSALSNVQNVIQDQQDLQIINDQLDNVLTIL